MLPMSNSPVKLQTLTLQVPFVQRPYGIRPFHGIWLLDALAYLLPIEGNTLRSLDFNVSRKYPTNNWIYAGDAEDIEEYVAVRQIKILISMFPNIHTLRLNQREPQDLKLNEYLMPEIASLIVNIKTVILYSVFPANEARDNFLERFGED
ncbi:hypothetical protein TWF569_009342 [Orbilia oligospora]|nr:hypothetical protein TWF569_009342 [Orbilia oligospora]